MTSIVDVENKMITLRNQQVILDSDVAELYGVKTKEINQAVKNNPRKFPEGYIWELSENEKSEVVKNFDHLQRLRFSPQLPKAFTERGLYMLATILKSPKAEDATIAIVEAYAKLRELAQVIAEVSQHEDNKAEQQSLLQRCAQPHKSPLNFCTGFPRSRVLWFIHTARSCSALRCSDSAARRISSRSFANCLLQ